ncbi:MAG: Transposase IS4 family protein [Candidatus Kaiserbacteria bacterium GW2011_GWA2_52_12]|uniref:Transposase IS4 family protein n=1 Tax=Candidatus Kaiserbacteria bacterium GW2011_GWA2_52_12 TaxID=1618671 RepID=A0A0G1X2F5_9BACT|nr:MAG: Transposase IS4 family protein [Candidatus Kaiserbacteria bacterium GW2011_GWA2_52_12]
MLHIRSVTTASGATAIQVVEYVKRKVKVRLHVGSAHSPEEKKTLIESAQKWMAGETRQPVLFPRDMRHSPFDAYDYVGTMHPFARECLHGLLVRFGFAALGNTLLHDLVIMRVIEPASKLRSIALIEQYFGITHRRVLFYQSLKKYLSQKDAAERCAVAVAKDAFAFDFSVVFYDVTTLYFETFKSDTLRKPGFSKDNKSQQPQIMLAIVVTKEGFPVSYDIFPGNTFEGHTMIPVIQALQKKHGIGTLTVVADAAMISAANIEELKKHNLRYIVGARMGTLDLASISEELGKRDGATVRTVTKLGTMVCHFSAKRYAHDKQEMEKQLARAKTLVQTPGKVKRAKFLKAEGASYALNEELLLKTKLRLGIKGYYTDLGSDWSDLMIVERYRDLWRIEQAFRVEKGDLATRPIFHFKEDPIRVHVLMCFMALAVSKYMEIKTGLSIRRITDALMKVTDVSFVHRVTRETETLRSPLLSEITDIVDKLGLSH